MARTNPLPAAFGANPVATMMLQTINWDSIRTCYFCAFLNLGVDWHSRSALLRRPFFGTIRCGSRDWTASRFFWEEKLRSNMSEWINVFWDGIFQFDLWIVTENGFILS